MTRKEISRKNGRAKSWGLEARYTSRSRFIYVTLDGLEERVSTRSLDTGYQNTAYFICYKYVPIARFKKKKAFVNVQYNFVQLEAPDLRCHVRKRQENFAFDDVCDCSISVNFFFLV